MAHGPAWARRAAPRAPAKGAGSPIACIVFVTAMGAAFWIGALWASQSWWALMR
jgi:hypothetical protein